MAYKINYPKKVKLVEAMRVARKNKTIDNTRNYLLEENININKHNYSWTIDDKGKSKFTLGNMTDAGWFWDGGEEDAVGFAVRLQNSHVKDEFLKDTEDFDFKSLKPMFLKSAKKGNGLYELSGDNRVWNFGETSESEYDMFDEEKFTEEEKSKFYNYYKGDDFDEFEKKYGKNYKTDMENAIKSANNFNEYFDNIEGLKDGIMEDYFNYNDENKFEAMEKVKRERPEMALTIASENPEQKRLDEFAEKKRGK